LSKNGINANGGTTAFPASSLNTTMHLSTLLAPQTLQPRQFGTMNGTATLSNMTTQRDIYSATNHIPLEENLHIMSGETMLSGPDFYEAG
jgi:hypothetical protein